LSQAGVATMRPFNFYFLLILFLVFPLSDLHSKGVGSKSILKLNLEDQLPSKQLQFTRHFNNDALKKQKKLKNKVHFKKALFLALKNFISQSGEGNETPLDIVLDNAYERLYLLENTDGTVKQKEINVNNFAKQSLTHFLNSKKAIITLVKMKKVGEDLGFNPYKNWVFRLQIPELTDYSFWAVVSRNDKAETPYIYGQN
jgi:hypothetical protein